MQFRRTDAASEREIGFRAHPLFFICSRHAASPFHAKIIGRGAQSATVSTRFGLAARETRDYVEQLDGPSPKLRTRVTEKRSRTILSFNQSPDIPFDRSINAYHDLSPGLDFETQLFAKPNAAEILRETLAKPKYSPRPIAMGTNTDSYQPIERRYRITRQVLEVCLEARHPVTITTKSDRVIDDLDLLSEMASMKLIAVAISVISLDPRLSGKLEPRAASPAKRLSALGKLTAAGIPTHCSISPVIPAVTDEFMEEIIKRAAELGVQSAGWIPLRLPHEVAPLFREWLEVHFADRAGKVMSIVRSIRNGRDNDPDFFSRMKPSGVWTDLFRARFNLACKRAGLRGNNSASERGDDFQLDCGQFRKPEIGGQLRLI